MLHSIQWNCLQGELYSFYPLHFQWILQSQVKVLLNYQGDFPGLAQLNSGNPIVLNSEKGWGFTINNKVLININNTDVNVKLHNPAVISVRSSKKTASMNWTETQDLPRMNYTLNHMCYMEKGAITFLNQSWLYGHPKITETWGICIWAPEYQ